ncbi:hypothetical protein SAMN05444166_0675 [Singulisphaera sp. GP187]|uniref:Ig-like domain-containing protein n=1 Tax=Singulisphaera sp. GP187 TaxID=1882752 RepID=UPI0009281B0D|nr:Ig-like domain-containing protein [Singulisphaera sp. GP187]SIN75807.1 hypothetical protein SAMN05444166_0675 [Singulisphaera sp. GP187]
MNNHKSERRRARGRVFHAEVLEGRALLTAATESFTGPALSGLIAEAWRGKNTSAAAINLMVGSLQTQLTKGPLADLTSGAVDGNGFIQEVQNLEASFEQDVDRQLLPHFANVDTMIKLQGQRVVADLIALNQQDSVGLLLNTDLAASAKTTIASLTDGPIHALGTPAGVYSSTTQRFESNLKSLVQALGTSATTPLTVAQVAATLTAEAEAYRAEIHAAAQVTHPQISAAVDKAVTNLENTAASIAASGTTDAQAKFTTAITTFDTAILDNNGLFGPRGAVSRVVAQRGFLPANPTAHRPSTTLSKVSGTAESGGNATLTATLTSAASGTGVAGSTVEFTLDGAYAGIAVTDANGVATLTNVATTASAGTDVGSVYARFAGNIGFKPSIGSGDLTVS